MLYGVGCGIAVALVVLASREGHSTRAEPTSYALPLDLPKLGCGGDTKTVFRVTLAADGTTSVDDRALPDDAMLLPLARSTFGGSRGSSVTAFIDADASVAHGRVVHAIDVLKQAGATEVTILDSRMSFP